MNCPLLLGHRGARATRSVPENSLASFDLALQHGCDGIEFDVRITSDQKAIVCHDAVWHPPRRLSGLTVANATRDQLTELPSLDQVLKLYCSRAFLDIELKVCGIEKILVSALRDAQPESGLVVSSFLPEAVLAIHREDSTLPLGLICESRQQLNQWPTLPVSYVIVNQRLLNQALVDQLQSEGKQVMVWTVNDAAGMRRFATMGVDAVISDQTELLVRTLRKNSSTES
jgi:glycerophosphoryl diester phosphodiesterase